MGYIVFKLSDESKNAAKAENAIDDSALTQLTDAQRKTIWEWCKYLGKALVKAILTKLIGTIS